MLNFESFQDLYAYCKKKALEELQKEEKPEEAEASQAITPQPNRQSAGGDQ